MVIGNVIVVERKKWMWKIDGRAEVDIVFINADYFSWILNWVINKLVSHVYQMVQIANVPQTVVSQQNQ